MIGITIEGIEDVTRALLAAKGTVGDVIALGVREAIYEGAQEAKATHRYTDRTGNLTASIRAVPGVYARTGSDGDIVATMPYASYVENGTYRSRPYPFMAQAYQRAERVLLRAIAAGLPRAQADLDR